MKGYESKNNSSKTSTSLPGRRAASTIRALVRQQLKPWIPEAGVALARRALARIGPAAWEYVGCKWPVESGLGWNDPTVVATQVRKWNDFLAQLEGPAPLGINHEAEAPSRRSNIDIESHNLIMSFGYVAALASRQRDCLSVLDWGGGLGHYAALTECLLPGLELRYTCKDVPSLVNAGQTLQPSVHFVANDEEALAHCYDFVFCGSSLQYAPDWGATLRRLAEVASGYLYVTRTLFVDEASSYVALQRPAAMGYRTEYPGWVFNAPDFLRVATEAGMTLVREFAIGSGPFIYRAPEQPTFRGYLFRPANNSVASGSGTW